MKRNKKLWHVLKVTLTDQINLESVYFGDDPEKVIEVFTNNINEKGVTYRVLKVDYKNEEGYPFPSIPIAPNPFTTDPPTYPGVPQTYPGFPQTYPGVPINVPNIPINTPDTNTPFLKNPLPSDVLYDEDFLKPPYDNKIV